MDTGVTVSRGLALLETTVWNKSTGAKSRRLSARDTMITNNRSHRDTVITNNGTHRDTVITNNGSPRAKARQAHG